MAETRKLAAFLRRMWSDSASLPGPTRSGHLPAPSWNRDFGQNQQGKPGQQGQGQAI